MSEPPFVARRAAPRTISLKQACHVLHSQIKELLELLHRVRRVGHGVTNGARIGEDLVVVTALKKRTSAQFPCTERLMAYRVGLVTEEVDLLEAFVRNMVQTEGFVPAIREDVERDLATDCKCEAKVCELLLQHLDECLTDTMLLKRQIGENHARRSWRHK